MAVIFSLPTGILMNDGLIDSLYLFVAPLDGGEIEISMRKIIFFYSIENLLQIAS